MYSLTNKSFLKLLDLTSEEISQLLALSADLKAKKKAGIPHRMCEGKNIVLLFEKYSTRTRCAFEVAGADLGMNVTYLGPSGSQMGKKESIADTARVLGRMYDGIEYRGYGQAIPYGNTGVFCQIFHDGLGKTTVLNTVVHSAQHPGGIGNGLFLAHLRTAGS